MEHKLRSLPRRAGAGRADVSVRRERKQWNSQRVVVEEVSSVLRVGGR